MFGWTDSYAIYYSAVIETLREVQKKTPERKCFRMIGGVLVERNVKEVLPALEANLAGVSPDTKHMTQSAECVLSFQLRTVMETLAKQYKAKDEQVVKIQADAKR